MVEHGEYLVDGYYPNTNHGLFMDVGLIALAHYLPFLDRADEWRSFAVDRFRTTLRRHVQRDEGFHLEHSPQYHFLVMSAFERAIVMSPRHDPLLDRMREAGRWLVMPDGTLPQLGDTDRQAAPEVEPIHGLADSRRSGYGIVRQPGAYLAVTAGYHATTHKHADDTSFVLYEQGHSIVADTGRHSYQPDDPHRQYALSAPAHSVLTVDGESPPLGRPLYGSGILATGEGAGWFAILARNRLLERQEANHWRLFLYRPGEALILVDRAWSSRERDYRRHVHLGPDISVQGDGATLDLTAEGFAGTLYDTGDDERTISRGREEPLSGWTFPGQEQRVPRFTVEYRRRAKALVAVTTFGLGRDRTRATLERRARDLTVVRVSRFGVPRYDVTVARAGEGLAVTEEPVSRSTRSSAPTQRPS